MGFIGIFEKTAFGSEHRFFIRFWCQIGSILASFWLSWAALGVSWGVLGASCRLLAASWGVFGPSCAPLGASWRVLARLGRVWARLGCVLARFGSQNHPKINPPAVPPSAIGHHPPPDLPLSKDIYPAEPTYTQRSARDKIAKALPVIRQPSVRCNLLPLVPSRGSVLK